MFPDFKELLSEFNAHQVKYLVVGGYAVSFHAQPRATKDLDVLISADAENSKAVFAALAKFGAPVQGLRARDFTEPGNFFRMGTPPVMVDILPSISGVDFEEAWTRRVPVAVDDSLTVPFISRQDLLAAKIAAGRPQDLADVAALEQVDLLASNQQSSAASSSGALDEIRDAQRKSREDWLRLREQRGASPTPEETRAKAREDWLKMRKHKRIGRSQRASQNQSAKRDQDRDLDRQGSAGDARGAEDDLDSE